MFLPILAFIAIIVFCAVMFFITALYRSLYRRYPDLEPKRLRQAWRKLAKQALTGEVRIDFDDDVAVDAAIIKNYNNL